MTHATHGFRALQDGLPQVPPTPTLLHGLNLEAETGGSVGREADPGVSFSRNTPNSENHSKTLKLSRKL